MAETILTFLAANTTNAFYWACWLGILFFFYGVVTLLGKRLQPYDYEVIKPSFWKLLKEHFLYFLFVVFGIVCAFHIQNLLFLALFVVVGCAGVYFFLFSGEKGNPEEPVVISDVSILPGEVSKADIFHLVLGIAGFMYITYMCYYLMTGTPAQVNENGDATNVINYVFAVAGPAVYSILFWISHGDRKYHIILERYLYALMLLGAVVYIAFYPALIENSIISFFFISIIMAFIGLLGRLRIMPSIGYMDIPVFFSLAVIFNYYAIGIFFIIMLLNLIEGIFFAVKDKNMGKEREIGMYGYSYIGFIILYMVFFYAGL